MKTTTDSRPIRLIAVIIFGCAAGMIGKCQAAPKGRLFPADLPAAEWVEFRAAGYEKPVTGVIYREGKMLPGMPLGALGTGFVSLGTDGTLDHVTTIFSDYMVRGFRDHRVLRKSVPSRRLPFLGISVGGKTEERGESGYKVGDTATENGVLPGG